MNQPADRRAVDPTSPVNGSPGLPAAAASPQSGNDAAQECCDRCGSLKLIRVKACWRCETCGYKSDCNGW
jgi:hypothetical protein